jgi:hypothetical protein
MRGSDLTRIKIKRILIYFQELNRLKVRMDATTNLICYVFGISEAWMLQIIKNNDLQDFKGIDLFFLEGDLKIIDAYVNKLSKDAKRERRNEKNSK